MSGQGHIAIHDMEGPRIRLVQIYTHNSYKYQIHHATILHQFHPHPYLSESPALLEIKRGEASELIP